MTVWSVRAPSPHQRKIDPPRPVRVTHGGPFVGMFGLAVREDEQFVWVKFDQPGSYAPCDHPGTYGLSPDQLEDA